MKTKNNTRLFIKIKLWQKGRVVVDTDSSHKERITQMIGSTLADSGYIKVKYGNGFTNFGHYDNKQELLAAYLTFTEKDLVQTVQRMERSC